MTVGFYFHEHMRRATERGLRDRGYHVVMAVDVDMTGSDDDTEHLPYATQQGLVMVTFDRPFAGRTTVRSDHAGLICLSETVRDDIGAIIRILVAFAEAHSVDDIYGRVFWLK
jgi:hypothetical protein